MATRKTKHINTLLEIQQPGYIIGEAKFLVKLWAFYLTIYMFWQQGTKQSYIYFMHFADGSSKSIFLKQ